MKTRIGGPATALKCFFILAMVIGVTWLNQHRISLLETQDYEAMTTFSSAGEYGREAVTRDALSSSDVVETNSTSVMRDGDQCVIRQAVRNLGHRSLSKIPLNIAFEDDQGNALGGKHLAWAVGPLGAGDSSELSFSLPCPQAAAVARVNLPDTMGETDNEPEIALLARAAAWAESEEGSYRVAVAMPDPRICPPPDSCRLSVGIPGGATTKFTFRRDRSDPAELTSTDSILVAHLQRGGNAIVRAQLPRGEMMTVSVSGQNLVQIRQSSSLADWLRKTVSRMMGTHV